MKISELFENFFVKNKKYISESSDFESELKRKIEDKLSSEKNISTDIDYDYLLDQIKTQLIRKGFKDSSRLDKETDNIAYIYAEDDSVNYDAIFTKIIPLAVKYLSLQPHFSLSGIDSLESLIETVKEGDNIYTNRNSFYGYYVDVLPNGKLLLELDKKLHNDRFAPRGFNFMHFLVKLEDMFGKNLNKFEVANLIKIYIKDNSLNYDNFFNKFVPEALKYLEKEGNTLAKFNSYDEFKTNFIQ